ncbi:MAG: LLM class flavin-dependent oxidoreductase [Alphaproteobacteria bacterium]|nr:LLM class flavin-dependent oxidoreductase [Alphaproteobacteria bacterium]
MSIELLVLGDSSIAGMVERVKLAEANGYDKVWLADERFYREVYSCLAIFAAHTSQVKLGPCVTDPFARHPALTAMAIATLDEISNQRAILGLGAGISGFGELGLVHNKPPRAIRESIDLIRRLLTGEQVDFHGEVIQFNDGHLSFKPPRVDIPVYVASNGPLGQRSAGASADAAIMEACGSVPEVTAFRAEVERGASRAGRDPRSVKLIARLNACVAKDGRAARDIVRPSVARLLGRRSLKLATAEAQGLTLPEDAIATVGPAPYAEGVKPYLKLLPLVSDRHVDAFTLAGTVDEIVEHIVALRSAGIDDIIIRPFAADGGTVEDTIVTFGRDIWPAVERSAR